MAADPERDNVVDRLTALAMQQASRRNFLGGIGVAGLAAFGMIPGLRWLAQAGSQPSPNGIVCSTAATECESASDCGLPCNGICSCSATSCITGGRQCAFICTPTACGCSPEFIQAHGSWQCTCGFCFFSCVANAC